MSGPRDAREHGEQADEAAPLKLPAFGLEAPWWAAESADAAPPAEQAPEMLSAPVVEEALAEEALAEADVSAPEAPRLPEVPTAPHIASAPPGTLVAGRGVPRVDSRGAVPAEPIVKPPISPDETDPEGFPPVPPVQGGFPDATPRGEGAGVVTPETEATVEHPAATDTATDIPASLSAFEKAKKAEDSASLAPVLVPDAILPPGVVPPTGSGPFPHADPAAVGAADAEQPQAGTPLFPGEGAAPADAPPPGRPPQGMPVTGRAGGKGRPVLIGGVAAVILAAVGALFLIGGTGSDGDDGKDRRTPESPAAAQTTPPVTPSATAAAPVDITNEKTDTADLTFHDVFPTETIRFGDRTYLRDRWSLNRDVTYAARGSMLAALRKDQCRKIVRATYIDPESKLAVTSGIAVMPTKAAAIAVSKSGDPARYEWFRGMAGKRSPDIDQAGGYAAATVRGRYVAYAYVQWANGRKAKPGDPTIKKAAQLFLDYDLRPIVARSRG
ncbi:hypothetical protein [Actinomadura citrea]|uniref:Uncharacterized protein n=1 Tax=Actinomadura citrea TaxID=46158 RepID=A0A7Y9GIS9_9ACTN|nr:hypothetical protein [Actinomadura citrea]NYE17280.1 hypothetical protein [Actinomadura citrea]GGT92923.1 hypothetical protein GCM10010177_60330 [Actinomadura citrea]